MLRLSKKVEYALLALQSMAYEPDKKFTAKMLSDELNISFEFLSKALQKLMRYDIIKSHQGINGGYILSKEPDLITVSDIVNALDENISVVRCLVDSDEDCARSADCTIKDPMTQIQEKIQNIFDQTTIAELARKKYYNIQIKN